MSLCDASTLPQAAPPQGRLCLDKLAGFIGNADGGTKAALARLDPDNLRPHQMAALSRAFVTIGLEPENWQASNWKRWALVAHGMALAGHANGRLGEQLATAGVAEPRVTKLLVSRGDAFFQALPSLIRLLASKQVQPNWYELSKLIFGDDPTNIIKYEEVENCRRRIAGDYFASLHRTNKTQPSESN